MAYVVHGGLHFGKRSLVHAEEYLLKGLEFCEMINLYFWNFVARLYLGETYFETRDFSSSKEHYEKGSWALEGYRLYPSLVSWGRLSLARSKVMNKEKDVNLEWVTTLSRNNKVRVIEGWMPRYIGEILLNVEDPKLSEAEEWIHKAIEADQRNQSMFNLGKGYALYGALFNLKGERLKARENFGKAREIFKECGADGWVEKTEKDLAGLP
jgi:tetratricopeptide (TPR) repeat protein